MPNARKTRLAATKKRVRTVPLQYTTIIEHCAPFFKGNAKVFFVFSRGKRTAAQGGDDETPAVTPSVTAPKQASDVVTASRAVVPALLLFPRICAGALKRRALCAVSKFAGGKKPTGLFARKRLLTPQEGA